MATDSRLCKIEEVLAGLDSLPASDRLVAVLPQLLRMLMAAVSHLREVLDQVRHDRQVADKLAGIEAVTAELFLEDEAALPRGTGRSFRRVISWHRAAARAQ